MRVFCLSIQGHNMWLIWDSELCETQMWVMQYTNKLMQVAHSENRTEKCLEKNCERFVCPYRDKMWIICDTKLCGAQMWVIHDTIKLVQVTHSEFGRKNVQKKNLRALLLIDWASRNPKVKPKLCETQKWVKLMKDTHSEIWTKNVLGTKVIEPVSQGLKKPESFLRQIE